MWGNMLHEHTYNNKLAYIQNGMLKLDVGWFHHSRIIVTANQATSVNPISGDPPYIINLPADTSVTLAENSPVGGVVVFTVKAMNGYNYGEVVSPDLVFNMTSDSCNAFTIDPVTGA